MAAAPHSRLRRPRGRAGAGAAATPRQGRRGAGEYSLDEVAGALLREALLPSAGQVCEGEGQREGEKESERGRRGENFARAPEVPPRPRRGGGGGAVRRGSAAAVKAARRPGSLPAAPGHPPERIMWPELTGSPVRGCSQVVVRVRSLGGGWGEAENMHLLVTACGRAGSGATLRPRTPSPGAPARRRPLTR